MPRGLKIALHVFIFIVAFVIFYIGLFMGLQVNSNIGTGLWILAAAIAALNLAWIIFSRR